MTLAGLSDVVAASVAEVVRRETDSGPGPLPEVALERCPLSGPGDYATAVALRLGPLVGLPATHVAGRIAEALAHEPAVEAAHVTGPGFVTIVVRRRLVETLSAVLQEIEALTRHEPSPDALLPVVVPTAPAELGGLRAAVVAEAVERVRRAPGAHAVSAASVADRVGVVELLTGGSTDPWARLADVEPAALRFELLRHPVAAPLLLDIAVLGRDSVVNPGYLVRHAAARCADLLRNAAEFGIPEEAECAVPGATGAESLEGPAASQLVDALASYSEVVRTAATRSEPHRLARHLERIADALLALVSAGDVLPRGDEPAGARHRTLVLAVRTSGSVLRHGSALLGIPAPVRL